MTILEIILVIIGGILTLFFLFTFLLPPVKSLEWTTVINRPSQDIYHLVSDYSNYKKWNPWSAMEPEADGEMSGKASTIGHKWSWNGEKIGKGYLQIKKLEPGKLILSDLIFEKPREMESEDIWRFEPIDDNTTRVHWGHKAYLGYPMGRVFGLMLKKMLGKDFEQGLRNLKELSEAPDTNG